IQRLGRIARGADQHAPIDVGVGLFPDEGDSADVLVDLATRIQQPLERYADPAFVERLEPSLGKRVARGPWSTWGALVLSSTPTGFVRIAALVIGAGSRQGAGPIGVGALYAIAIAGVAWAARNLVRTSLEPLGVCAAAAAISIELTHGFTSPVWMPLG